MPYNPLTNDLALALDRVAFMRSLGYLPDTWQGEFLESDAKRVILNCSRQAGKSTVTAVLALHEALYKSGSLILLLSASFRQSLELYQKVIEGYLRLGNGRNDDALATVLKLENGSKIVSLPSSEKTIRGYSGVDLLVCDEASRIPDDLFFAVTPMLAVSGGRLIMLSTPFGQRGVFHELWVNSDEYQHFRVTAEQCPRISKEFLDGERRALPSRIFRQEYMCEFLQTDDAVFSYDDVIGLVSDDISPLFEVRT